MWHRHSNKLYVHTSKNYLCAVSKNSVERVLEKKILKGLSKMCYIQIVLYSNSLERALSLHWVQNMCNVTRPILPGAGNTV